MMGRDGCIKTHALQRQQQEEVLCPTAARESCGRRGKAVKERRPIRSGRAPMLKNFDIDIDIDIDEIHSLFAPVLMDSKSFDFFLLSNLLQMLT